MCFFNLILFQHILFLGYNFYIYIYVFLHRALFSYNTSIKEIIERSFLLQLVEYFILFKLTMEKLDIDYSLKNIPIPSNESYLIKLIEKIESVVKRMRWRAHFFLQEKHESDIRREDFGFKSKITPPQCEHMEAFEKELLNIIPNIKSRSVKDAFQKRLKEDILKIKQSPNVFVFADKTSNIYEMPE